MASRKEGVPRWGAKCTTIGRTLVPLCGMTVVSLLIALIDCGSSCDIITSRNWINTFAVCISVWVSSSVSLE